MTELTAPTMKRPVAALVLAALLLVMAFYNLFYGFWMFFASMSPESNYLYDYAGNPEQVSGFFLFFNGLISIVFGLMLFWLFRLTMVGSATAHMLISFLAILNIVFSMFRLPTGWGVIAVSIIVLILVNTKASKDWFLQNP